MTLSPNLFFECLNRLLWVGVLCGEGTHAHHHAFGKEVVAHLYLMHSSSRQAVGTTRDRSRRQQCTRAGAEGGREG